LCNYSKWDWSNGVHFWCVCYQGQTWHLGLYGWNTLPFWSHYQFVEFLIYIFHFSFSDSKRWLLWDGYSVQHTHTHTHIFYLSLFVLIMSYMQAQTAQEESIRMTAIRKTYQKAIITPTHHVEQLWREYENFENSVSRQLVMFSYGIHLWSKPYSC